MTELKLTFKDNGTVKKIGVNRVILRDGNSRIKMRFSSCTSLPYHEGSVMSVLSGIAFHRPADPELLAYVMASVVRNGCILMNAADHDTYIPVTEQPVITSITVMDNLKTVWSWRGEIITLPCPRDDERKESRMNDTYLMIEIAENVPTCTLYPDEKAASDAMLARVEAHVREHEDGAVDWDDVLDDAHGPGYDDGTLGVGETSAYSRLDGDRNMDWYVLRIPAGATSGQLTI